MNASEGNRAGKVAMRPLGPYEPTRAYEVLDIVEYEYSAYCCKQTSTGNTPSRDSEYWMYLCSAPEMENLVLKTDIATDNKLGIVRPDGETITIDANGVIHGAMETPIATEDTVGTVKPDNVTVSVDDNGALSVTPDDELDDGSENTVQNKVVKAALDSKVGTITKDLLIEASGWADDEYVINDDDIEGDSDGMIGLSANASSDQRIAVRDASFGIKAQVDGALTLIADRGAPAIDVPITLILLK